jgi:Fe-S cluster assembly protein SufD
MTAKPAIAASAEATFDGAFAASGLAAQSASWVREARQSALQAAMKSGLPHRKLEAWKYTDLRKFLAPGYSWSPASTGVGANGAAETMLLSEALEQPGLWLRTLFEPGSSFVGNVNQALAAEGALIRIPANAIVDEPISIHHDGPAPGAMSHARGLVQLEPGSRATIVETIKADDASLATSVIKIDVQDGAHLTHIRIVESGAGAIWLAEDAVTLAPGARYDLTQVQGGAGLVRIEPNISLAGEKAEAHLSGATVGAMAGHIDWRLNLHHRAPDTVSRLRARTVLGAKSFGAVQGGVAVAQAAQKTDSHQMAKSLLLSPHAQSVHKPELEIFADDVKCGHGAATGALNPDQLFYLRARGIPAAVARHILVEGFLEEIVEGLPEGMLRDAAEAALRRLLAQALEAAT